MAGVRDRLTGVDRSRVGLYAALLALAAFYLVPLETGLATSLKTSEAFRSTIPLIPPAPGEFTLEPWFTAFGRLQGPLTDLSGSLANSVTFAVPATLLSALIGSTTAYGLTHVNWRGQVGILVLILAGVFLPYQSVLVPLTQFWLSVSRLLTGTVTGRIPLLELLVTHVAYGVPICTVLVRGYYLGFDDEMLEAARLDGAGVWRIYRKIVFPLSIPMFGVVLIYQFTQIWNDLLFALVLEAPVVTIALNALSGSFVSNYSVQMAGAFVAAGPTILVYVLFGKQFAEGVAGGGA